MIVSYKGKDYTFPTSLDNITLSQRVAFDDLYLKKNEEFLKTEIDELEMMLFDITIAAQNFSFFSGLPLEEVEQNIPVDNLLNVFYSCFEPIYKQQSELLRTHFWNDETWHIATPELTYSNNITFNELIVSKQIVKQMHDLGAGNWRAIQYLACVFLKRENETFNEKWLEQDSERFNLMADLPMSIAVSIGFFLRNSMNIYTLISPFSQARVLETA